MSIKSLNTLPDIIPEEVWDIWWDERTKVGMMNDKHLENALLKLQGLGKEEYDASNELRRQWLTILVTEKSRRADMRKATFDAHGELSPIELDPKEAKFYLISTD